MRSVPNLAGGLLAALFLGGAVLTPLFAGRTGRPLPPAGSDGSAIRAARSSEVGRPTESPPTPPRRQEGQHWAFRRLHPIPVPGGGAIESSVWARNEVDRFILQKLAEEGLRPAPEADRATLVRRVYFDLTGLPPSPEEATAFVEDPDTDAYERLVDRLLASPRYGERWARHWLDLARYADSGGFEADWDRPGAYHYRDFVIRALNRDLPYDTFLSWQLAGDELAPGNEEAMAATGFCTAGPTVAPGFNKKARYDELDDIVATTGQAMLGLSLGCARCHDHRFDPVSQREYYRLTAVFAHSRRTERAGTQPQGSDARPMLVLTGAGGAPGFFLAHGVPEDEQDGVRVRPGFLTVLSAGTHAADPDWTHWSPVEGMGPRAALARWLTDPKHGAGPLTARTLVNRVWQHHFGRALAATPDDLGKQGDAPSHPELLDWLAYRFAFGGGDTAWRLKPLHRLILTSAAYRQSNTPGTTGHPDPENWLLARRRPTRLEAEPVRDAMLAVSGCLNLEMFGPGIRPRIPPGAIARTEPKYGVRWPEVERDGPATWRRSVYIFQKRSNPFPLLKAFDAPEAVATCGRRPTTTVPAQALTLLNDEFVREQATYFAARVQREAGGAVEAQIRRAFVLALGREPDAGEFEQARMFLAAGRRRYHARKPSPAVRPADPALTDFCQVLFALNEFIYVD